MLNDANDQFRVPSWIVDLSREEDSKDGAFLLSPLEDDSDVASARDHTWRWCRDFIAEYNLCPWARASVESPGAVHLYLTNSVRLQEDGRKLLSFLATDFMNNTSLDRTIAIYFVVFLDEDNVKDFSRFYEWFVELEESGWDMQEDVTLAPFHPNWCYMQEESGSLEMEKQSPYPTISLVATTTIDQAGDHATRTISEHNEKVLNSKSLATWRKIYDVAVWNKT